MSVRRDDGPRRREGIALAVLLVGMPPVIATIAGWVVLATSSRWSVGQKVLGALTLPAALPFALLFVYGLEDRGMQVCVDPAPGYKGDLSGFGCFSMGPPMWKLAAYIAGVGCALGAAVYLWRAARRDVVVAA